MDEAVRLFRDTREYLTPVLNESAFLEKGMLTPEEFVRAGDHLSRTSPAWKWESGDPTKLRPYLPNDKQYLIIRGVASYERVSALENNQYFHATEEEEGADGSDWWDPSNGPDGGSTLPDIASVEISPATKPVVIAADEYLDLEDEDLVLDESTIKQANSNSNATTNANQLRRYDVSITYDNYYRTPRIWLYGYDESGTELDPTAVFEDVVQDYAKRTVTIDPHPHQSKPHASIHPCRHGPAMLNIITALRESGNTPVIDQYLSIFLKFIQSVVPTIQYDYTMDVQVC